MRTFATTALALLAGGGLLLGTAVPASAEETGQSTDNAWVEQQTANGVAETMVFWSDSSGRAIATSNKALPVYASGLFFDDQTGFTMNAWLERSHDGGPYTQVSGVHAMTDHEGSIYTDGYYDGPGFMVRACFQFTSWSGAAVHCSPGI